jgi:RNA ligase
MWDVINEYASKDLIKIGYHPTLDLFILNYTEKVQYENLWDDFLLQARGLVVNSEGNIVARPFRKFFNIEEGKHTPTSEFDVYEKMDGSLIIVFWYDGGWVVASRGSFTSDQAIAAKKLLDTMNINSLSVGATYLFEYTSPWNRIVVNYGGEEKLTMLGAIDTDTGVEAPYSVLEFIGNHPLGCDVVKRYYGVTDYTKLKAAVLDNAEGFVVRFSNGDRMKVKGDEYVRLHKVMTNLSTTAIWEVLASGGTMDTLLVDVPDEFYSKIKEYENSLRYSYMSIQEHAGKLFDSLYESYDGELPNRKKYAEWVTGQNNFIQPILFRMYDKKDYSTCIWNYIKPDFRKL